MSPEDTHCQTPVDAALSCSWGHKAPALSFHTPEHSRVSSEYPPCEENSVDSEVGLWSPLAPLQQPLLLEALQTILHISALKNLKNQEITTRADQRWNLRVCVDFLNESILACFLKTGLFFKSSSCWSIFGWFLKLFLIRFSVSRSLVSSDKLSRRPQGLARRTKDSLLKYWLLCGRKAACSAAFYPFTVLLHVAKPASANESLFKRK